MKTKKRMYVMHMNDKSRLTSTNTKEHSGPWNSYVLPSNVWKCW